MLERGRSGWLALLERAGDRVLEPGAAGEWTLRDVLAHVNAYQRFLIGELGGKVRPFGDMTGDTGEVHQRNALMHEQDTDLSWEFVFDESRELHTELLRGVDGFSHAQLAEPMVTWMPWPRWRWIIGLTLGHYEEHNPGLNEWLGDE